MPDPDIPSNRRFLRCYCSRQPILAVYGVDKDGQPFVHMKVFKQHRIFCEAIYKGGVVKLICRECMRWHVITIRPNQVPIMAVTEKPIELDAGNTANVKV